MLGSIIGDICGSTYEFSPCKKLDLDLTPARSEITDDSILSFATAEVLLEKGSYLDLYRHFGITYPTPMGDYGAGFKNWLYSKPSTAYNSCGNGSAMRAGPIGWACSSTREVLLQARLSAEVTHSHPEGIKGAQATALAVFMARHAVPKNEIRREMFLRFGYDVDRTCAQIRPSYRFEATCQKTVPEALIAFFDSTNYEDALRLAISLGGDSDTLACITGGIAEAFYGGVPRHLVEWALPKIPTELLDIYHAFERRFMSK